MPSVSPDINGFSEFGEKLVFKMTCKLLNGTLDFIHLLGDKSIIRRLSIPSSIPHRRLVSGYAT